MHYVYTYLSSGCLYCPAAAPLFAVLPIWLLAATAAAAPPKLVAFPFRLVLFEEPFCFTTELYSYRREAVIKTFSKEQRARARIYSLQQQELNK